MRVIVESEDQARRLEAEGPDRQGAVDGGRAPETDTVFDASSEGAAIDAGPPPQELIEELGDRPPAADIAVSVASDEGIDAGAAVESE